MHERGWDRLATAAGVPFAVLLAASAVVGAAGSAPGEHAPASAIAAWFADHRTNVMWANYITGVGAVFFLWFLGGVRSALRAAEGRSSTLSTTALAGGLVLLAAWMGQGLAWLAATATVPASRDAAVARALFDLGNVFFAFGNFPAAALVGATSLVALQARVLPAWLGWAGIALTLMLLLGAMPLGAIGIVGFLATALLPSCGSRRRASS